MNTTSGTRARPNGSHHRGAHTAPKGKATPRRGAREAAAASRAHRRSRREWLVLLGVAVVLLALALAFGGGAGHGGIPFTGHG